MVRFLFKHPLILWVVIFIKMISDSNIENFISPDSPNGTYQKSMAVISNGAILSVGKTLQCRKTAENFTAVPSFCTSYELKEKPTDDGTSACYVYARTTGSKKAAHQNLHADVRSKCKREKISLVYGSDYTRSLGSPERTDLSCPPRKATSSALLFKFEIFETN